MSSYVYLLRPTSSRGEPEWSVNTHPEDVQNVVHALESLIRRAAVRSLTVREPAFTPPLMPPTDEAGPPSLRRIRQRLPQYLDGSQVTISVASALVEGMLRREGFWCRLEADGELFIHVGQSGEIYLGTHRRLPPTLPALHMQGVEILAVPKSPYDLAQSDDLEQRPADGSFWARVLWLAAMGEAVWIEEERISHVFEWHRLAVEQIETVRSKIGARARLRVWPSMETDTDKIAKQVVGSDSAHVVWEAPDGQVLDAECDASNSVMIAREVRNSRGAMVRILDANHAEPLFTAVMPDGDGVLRARWRTEPSASDRRWSAMRKLSMDSICTGKVTHFSPDGTTYVDIGFGIRAGLTLPELSWRVSDVPSKLLAVGEQVVVKIIEIDLVHEEVWVSRKALQDDPLQDLAQHVGGVVTGEVTKVIPIGCFVRIEPGPGGWEGLLPRGDFIRDVAPQVGDALPVTIVDVDLVNRRILLSPADK